MLMYVYVYRNEHPLFIITMIVECTLSFNYESLFSYSQLPTIPSQVTVSATGHGMALVDVSVRITQLLYLKYYVIQSLNN